MQKIAANMKSVENAKVAENLERTTSATNAENTERMKLTNSSKTEHGTNVPLTNDVFVLIKTEDEAYGESVHPFKNEVAMRRAGEQKKAGGYVLFPKVTKFSTYLISWYGKQIESELEKMFFGGEADYICEEFGADMNRVDRVTCSITPRMTLWRINRYEFIADVEVSIRADTWSGDDIECDINIFYASLNCCLDEELSYSIDSISVIKPDRARIRLDEYLIPIMTHEEMEQAAEGIWEQYLPEVFQDKGWLNPYRLAERMGLKVVFHKLHRRKKNRGLLFWKDGTVKIMESETGPKQEPEMEPKSERNRSSRSALQPTAASVRTATSSWAVWRTRWRLFATRRRCMMTGSWLDSIRTRA